MKTNTFFIALILLATINSNAQFGLDKIKKKVEDKKETNPKINSSQSTDSKLEIKESGKDEAYQKLSQMTNSIESAKNNSALSFLENTTVVNQKNYNEIKKYYSTHQNKATEYEQNKVVEMEAFFNNDLPKIKTEALKKIDANVSYTQKFLKENRSKPEYFKSQDMSSYNPESHITIINENLKHINNGLLMFDNDAEFIKRQEMLIARKADLENYISSGDLKKDIAKREQISIDERKLRKPGMVNAQLEVIVKKDMDVTNYGSVQRVSLVSEDWRIIKNNLGTPLSKEVKVQCVTKKDGKCYKVWGTLFCTYSGGGNYTSPRYTSDLMPKEMSCDNILKNETE